MGGAAIFLGAVFLGALFARGTGVGRSFLRSSFLRGNFPDVGFRVEGNFPEWGGAVFFSGTVFLKPAANVAFESHVRSDSQEQPAYLSSLISLPA